MYITRFADFQLLKQQKSKIVLSKLKIKLTFEWGFP